jgi:hypothetical protein
VTRTLLSEVGLHHAWLDARLSMTRTSSRAVWLALLQEHRGAGAKLMRAMNPAAYAWLYRNDRSWLAEHAPDRRLPTGTTRVSTVKWDERDLALSGAVQRTVLSLSNDFPGRAIRLWHIYQALPDVKPKLSTLYRLPLTRDALERALHGTAKHPQDDLFDKLSTDT